MLSQSTLAAVLNGFFQTFAIIAVNYNVLWPLYVVILMMFYMAFMQTIAASSFFSSFVEVEEVSESDGNEILRAMIAILYIFSAYKVYTIELEIISGIMVAHALIYLLTQFFSWVGDTSEESE